MLSDYKYFASFYLVLVLFTRWFLSLFKLPLYFSWLCSYLPIYWIIAIPKMYATDMMMGPRVKSFLALLSQFSHHHLFHSILGCFLLLEKSDVFASVVSTLSSFKTQIDKRMQ